MSDRTWGLLGVPSTAGSHNPGQDKAPAAWRAAGLVATLERHGFGVRDHGDLPVTRHRPRPPDGGVRDLGRVAEVVRATAVAVAEIASSGELPLVLGGDCTISLGVVAGLAQHRDVGLLYFDGDADLGVPESSDSGIADTMGMTHFLGGGRDELSRVGPRYPLVSASQVVLFGFDPRELDTAQWTSLNAHQVRAFTAPEVRADPVASAHAARRRLEEAAECFLLHLDVDVLDTGLFPLANFPHFAGLSLDEMAAALGVFCASPRLAGLVVTEVNPDHDPEGELLERVAEVVASALV